MEVPGIESAISWLADRQAVIFSVLRLFLKSLEIFGLITHSIKPLPKEFYVTQPQQGFEPGNFRSRDERKKSIWRFLNYRNNFYFYCPNNSVGSSSRFPQLLFWIRISVPAEWCVVDRFEIYWHFSGLSSFRNSIPSALFVPTPTQFLTFSCHIISRSNI